jgi:hypothetical protein
LNWERTISARGGDAGTLATAEVRRTALMFAEMKTAYGGFTVQHLGGTKDATWALYLLQRHVWTDGTAGTQSSQMRNLTPCWHRTNGLGQFPG